MIPKRNTKLFLVLSICGFGFLGLCGLLRIIPTVSLFLRPTEPTPRIEELIPKFSSPDIETRYRAAYDARHYYDDPDKARLIPYLVDALQESDNTWNGHRVREYAAFSLGRLEVYDSRAVEILTSWLTEPRQSGAELIQGIYVLGVFSDHAANATPGLIRLISDVGPYHPNDHTRAAAIGTLSAIGDPVAVPYLLKIFVSADELSWVRKIAGLALAKHGQASVCSVPYLISELDSPEPDITIVAALILSQATDNVFPNSQRENWDPKLGGLWIFDKAENQEYQVVLAAKNWWQNVGQYEKWPQCNSGLDGNPVIP
jgi:HEAT repeat protein